jgi:probable FeS assembly SUF system protein SufT
MDLDSVYELARDTTVTVIPAGHQETLSTGTKVTISQALGGTVTLRADSGLYRLASKDWDALGAEMADMLAARSADQVQTPEDQAFGEDTVWEALKNCFDPEIPVNIVDLGLIYDLQISEPDANQQHQVAVQMTLTAQGCGMGPVIAEDAKNHIERLSAVSAATVSIIWDPPWTPHMISAAGKEKLGLD